MRISQTTIDDVRRASDIVEIVSAHVKLKKRGKNYTGLCPFHTEKTPSFTVSAEKQMYHCFGCGKGGNVFTFVMDLEKVSFAEAVRSLAARAGIPIAEESPADAERQSELEGLYQACRIAGRIFHENLRETEEGKKALEYFKKRGFTDETIDLFGLGYSVNSWDALINRMKGEGVTPEQLMKAGLVRSRETGEGIYDYFRGRGMFPVFSTSGRVVGFGARKLWSDDPVQGKYINSPETPLYNKSRLLYGLFYSKDAIRQEDCALMVEGYADLISVFQAGVQNVVASSGTALTEEQLNLLGRYSKKIKLVYDADSAGSAATLRGVDLALAHDFDVEVVTLPQGEDPDSFVRTHGGAEFRERIGKAVSFIDFKAQEFLASGAFATPEGKTKAVRSIVQSIAKMKDELKRNFYLKDVSGKYDIYESVLHRELERWLSPVRRPGSAKGNFPNVEAESKTDGGNRPEVPASLSPAERDLIKALLEGDAELARYVSSNILPDDLTNDRAKSILRKIGESPRSGNPASETELLNELMSDEERQLISDIVLSKYELSEGWKNMEHEIDEPDPWQVAREAIRVLKRAVLQKKLDENQAGLKEAQKRGSEAMPFLRKQQELLQAMKKLEQGLSLPRE